LHVNDLAVVANKYTRWRRCLRNISRRYRCRRSQQRRSVTDAGCKRRAHLRLCEQTTHTYTPETGRRFVSLGSMCHWNIDQRMPCTDVHSHLTISPNGVQTETRTVAQSMAIRGSIDPW
jgi:hypothetical protein